jgi:hypothetical protein
VKRVIFQVPERDRHHQALNKSSIVLKESWWDSEAMHLAGGRDRVFETRKNGSDVHGCSVFHRL